MLLKLRESWLNMQVLSGLPLAVFLVVLERLPLSEIWTLHNEKM